MGRGDWEVALDAARVAKGLVDQVTLAYRRDREQMPAYAEEIQAAEAAAMVKSPRPA